jgi:hypothetical protein
MFGSYWDPYSTMYGSVSPPSKPYLCLPADGGNVDDEPVLCRRAGHSLHDGHGWNG